MGTPLKNIRQQHAAALQFMISYYHLPFRVTCYSNKPRSGGVPALVVSVTPTCGYNRSHYDHKPSFAFTPVWHGSLVSQFRTRCLDDLGIGLGHPDMYPRKKNAA